MNTVCPKCTLTLAVTAADLRAGQGYVRCGRCANVFNALLALSEEAGLAMAMPEAAPPRERESRVAEDRASATVSRPALTDVDLAAASQPARSPEPQPASAPEPRPSAAPALRLVDSPPRPLPPADTPDDELEVEEYRSTGTFETIVLEGDTFLQTEEMIPEEALDSELADVSRRIAAAHDAAAQQDPAGEQRSRINRDAAPRPTRIESRPPQPAELLGRTRAAPPARSSGLMIAAALALLLLLGVQMLNHWRNQLATRTAWYGPLSRAAALLREPLRPDWDLNSYDVRQLGASADSADGHSLRVRLSLANIGPRPLGMPLLRLTLLDRYGKAVSSGALRPEQYLPPALRGQRFIARDQRIDTEVGVLDPSQQATSFELDVCVTAADGGLRCAGDAPVAAGQS